MASRLESHAPVGEIACSQVIYEHLKSDFAIEKKGSVMMKGKGEQPLWILQGSRKD